MIKKELLLGITFGFFILFLTYLIYLNQEYIKIMETHRKKKDDQIQSPM